MRTLLLTGAGCTNNYDQATHGIDGLHPPLNKDFFRMARKVILYHELMPSKELQQLLRMICHLYRLKSDSELRFLESDRLSNLEDVMTNVALQETLFGTRIPPSSVSSRDTLRELIAFTIEVSLQGPICDLHKKLAHLIKPEDVIVTLNYDLILDEALRALKRFDDFSYGLPFYRIQNGKGSWKRPEESQGSMELLKLHGSINWARCIECGTVLKTSNPCEFLPLASLECPRCERKGGIERLIIPPIQTKEYNDDPYRYLWLHAARKIENIERIVALGYRFSPNDMAVRALLHAVSTRSPVVEVVNSTNDFDEILQQIRSIFPTVRPKRSRTLPEFSDQYQP